MKRCESFLIGLLAMSGASADSVDSGPLVRARLAPNGAAAQLSQSGLSGRWQLGRQASKAQLAGFKADVVQDMRATSAFVQEQANKARPSRGLMALAAFGLVMVQLRRKHKSLPQRRIGPYG